MLQPEDIDENDGFLTGLKLLVGAGDPALRKGVAYAIYAAGKSMPDNQVFTGCDGDVLLEAQRGALDVGMEMGLLGLRPSEIAVSVGVRYDELKPSCI